MNIKAFSEKYHISPDTARYYESEGLLTPLRSNNGYRQYDEGCERAIKYILVLKQTGFSLQEIKQLLMLEKMPISAACRASTSSLFMEKVNQIQQKIEFYQSALIALQLSGQIMDQGSYPEHAQQIEQLMNEMYIKIAETGGLVNEARLSSVREE